MTSVKSSTLSYCVTQTALETALGSSGNGHQVYQGTRSLLSSVAPFPGSGPFSTRVTAGVPRGNGATASGASSYVDRTPKDPSLLKELSIPNPEVASPNFSWYRIEQEWWTIVHMGFRPLGGNKCL